MSHTTFGGIGGNDKQENTLKCRLSISRQNFREDIFEFPLPRNNVETPAGTARHEGNSYLHQGINYKGNYQATGNRNTDSLQTTAIKNTIFQELASIPFEQSRPHHEGNSDLKHVIPIEMNALDVEPVSNLGSRRRLEAA